jgi:hypothetical protein
MDQTSDLSNNGMRLPQGQTSPYLFDPQLQLSLSSHHVGQNFTANLSYELPRTNASGIAGAVLDGWQLTGIVRLADGSPLSLSGSTRAQTNRLGAAFRPDLVPGGDNNPVLGGPDRYFDVTQFQLAQPGYMGTLGRNTLIGPGLATVDVSLLKNFPFAVAKNGTLRFRLEVFNVLNRANFAAPITSLFNAQGQRNVDAGKILLTSTRSRELQLGLRFVF